MIFLNHMAYSLSRGPKAYNEFQRKNLDKVLGKGVAFPFVRGFLNINQSFPKQLPVEVVLLSRNSAATGKRVFRSIAHYGLDISRAAFMEEKSLYQYISAFNASLFLSTNEEDVKIAINNQYPGGTVLPSVVNDDDEGDELRIAFDFDGVIADDESEAKYDGGDLPEFHNYEVANAHIPH